LDNYYIFSIIDFRWYCNPIISSSTHVIMKHFTFIDSSVFLRLYNLNDDQLEKLEQIINLISEEKIFLIVNQQVIDELNRARERRIGEIIDSLTSFRDKLNDANKNRKPNICKGLDGSKLVDKSIAEIQDKINATCKLVEKLIRDVREKANKRELHADILLKKIFQKSKIGQISDDVYRRAEKRFKLGNPPGKRNDPIGDAVNWEYLLENVPEGKTLYFIGSDNDFVSEINKSEFSHFLMVEWNEKKKADLKYYGSILDFLKENFQNTKIEKNEIDDEYKLYYEDLYRQYLKDVLPDLQEKARDIAEQYDRISRSPFLKSAIEDLGRNQKVIRDMLVHLNSGVILQPPAFLSNTKKGDEKDSKKRIKK